MMEDRINALISERIPLARHIGMQIVLQDNTVTIHAPLKGNQNHMGTGFAGSLSAICMLCGWAHVLNLLGSDFSGDIVLKDAQLRYLRPVESDIIASVNTLKNGREQEFMQTYLNSGKANLPLRVSINAQEKQAVAFRGTYTAFDL